MESVIDDRTWIVEDSNTKQNLPLGFQIKAELSTIFGDIIQLWTFLCFFHEILCPGRTTVSLKELTTELTEVVPTILYEAHMSMLRILLDMLITLTYKSKKGIENPAYYVAVNSDLAILNELTWPELAWRYASVFHLVLPSLERENLDPSQVHDISRYVHGDGGSACGVLTGIVGLKVDTQLFAAATKAIYGSLDHKDVLFIDDTYSDSESGLVSPAILTNDRIPHWVQELEPVKNLKTNVGSKIRTCIRKSIDKCPEEWAKELLEKSISKEVYKGNASGPTKNAALVVIARFHEGLKNAALRQRAGKSVSISTTVMRKCRILLRQVVNEFCKLRKGKRNLGSQHILTRPLGVRTTGLRLDFRSIDMRLEAGTYCGSFQAFKEDVSEVLKIISPVSSELVNKFEQEYKKEVLAVQKKLFKYSELESLDPESRKDVERLIATTNEIPEVFWDGILCQVCGVDKDDKELLLCDNCNEGYHIYCLCPPLSKVPEEDKWFCPKYDASTVACVASTCKERKESTGNFVTDDLVAMLQEREYWELNAPERVGWLKFFEDMMMYMTNVQDYAKKKASTSNKNSLGNKFLGVDSASRLYWKLDTGSKYCIVVGEKSTPHPESVISQDFGSIDVEHPTTADGSKVVSSSEFEDIFCGKTLAYSSWVCYQSEQEIKRIMDFVKGDKLMVRNLNDSVLKHPVTKQDVPDNLYWQNPKGLQSSSLKSSYPLTKATLYLQSSYSALAEFERNQLSERKLNKGKTIATDNMCRCECLELILPGRTLHCFHCHRTCAAIKELRSHGDGICNLPPMMPFKDEEMCSSLNGEGTSSVAVNEFENGTQRVGTCEDMEIGNTAMSSQKVDVELDAVGKFFEIPMLSKRPLKNEKSLDVLKHLKLSLLDMEAAIPEHAVKSSRACISRKQAWRGFIKSANTIYKMVQATLVFEDMIKPEFLGKSWQNWSSISAAAKISTLAALSLRIYALDAAISNSCSLEKPNLYPNATQGEAQHGQI